MVHYAGCSFCAAKRGPKLSNSIVSVCVDEFTKALVSMLCTQHCSAVVNHVATPTCTRLLQYSPVMTARWTAGRFLMRMYITHA